MAPLADASAPAKEPRRRPAAGRWGRVIWLTQALLGIAATLAIGELVVRQWIGSPSTALPDPVLGFVEPPHVRRVNSAEGHGVSWTNAQGLYSAELRVPRPRVRALLLGDSYSAAEEVPRAQNFVSVAERLAPDVEIVNAGMPGWSPAQYADFLDSRFDVFRPDLVIVQLNDGDMEDLFAEAARRARATGPAAPEEMGAGERIARRLLRHSALATAAYHRLTLLARFQRESLVRWRNVELGRKPAPPAPYDAVDPRVPPLFDALWDRMASHRVPIMLLYIPQVSYLETPCGAVFRRQAFYHDFAARHHAVLVDPCEEFCAAYARTHQPLHGFQNSIMGQGHMNAAGHRVVGGLLAKAIGEVMR
jgi:hypothetical protein